MRLFFVAGFAMALAACASATPQQTALILPASEPVIAQKSAATEAPPEKEETKRRGATPVQSSSSAAPVTPVSLPVSPAAPKTLNGLLLTSEAAAHEFAADLDRNSAARALLPLNEDIYEVSAELLDMKQPFAGIDMTVTSIVAYRVTGGDASVVHEEVVEAAYTVRAVKALAGVERLRRGRDGALRENVSAFLAALNNTGGTD